MTTGGIELETLRGSEDLFLFRCSPCCRKGRATGAEVYCLQCKEYFCGICLDHHNSFAMMATHTPQDRAEMEAKGPQRVQPLLTVPCEEHPGQGYSLYCRKHEKVCCPVCSLVHHKFCDVTYIPDVLHEVARDTDVSGLKRATKAVQADMGKLKEKRKKDMENLTAQKDAEVDKIQNSIEGMRKELQVIEKSAIDDVTKMHADIKGKIESDLVKIDQVGNSLDAILNKLERANDRAEQFVHMKNAKQIKSSGRELIEDVEAHVGRERMTYTIDKEAEESLRGIQSLGKLVLDYEYSVSKEGMYQVDTELDAKVCDINDICLDENGDFLVADWSNQCVKRFDKNFNIIDCLKLDSGPYGVCSTSEGQAAVTLRNTKTVRILTLGTTMGVRKSFKTADACRGILCHQNQFYITCYSWGMLGAGPGYVAVFSMSGTLVRKMDSDNKGRLFSSVPFGIAVRSMHDDVILVCDRSNGLVALGKGGQRLWTATCKELMVDSVNKVCLDSHGQILVSSYMSNKVVLVSGEGRKLGELLTARDGINKPEALCLDSQRSRVMAAMEHSSNIIMFRLK